jgi:pilus assembly protein CpaC
MHRTSFLPRPVVWTVLFAAWLFGPFAVEPAHAQEKLPPPPTAVYMPTNSTDALQMSKLQIVKEFKSDAPLIVRVEAVKNDPRKVLLTSGKDPGTTLIYLKDEKDVVEIFQVTVETDVDLLRRIIRNVFPTANVQVTKAGNNIILSGTVAKATDVAPIISTARSIAGGDLKDERVINSLTVGGVQQVQLDVIVARVARSEARNMGFSFLESGSQHFIGSTVAGSGSLTGALTTGITNPAASLTAAPNIVFGLLDEAQAFTGFLQALRTDNLVKLIAKPRLIGLSGQIADFISGGEQAVPEIGASAGAGGAAVAGVKFVPFGTTLKFLPIVLGGGKIYLEVEPQFTFPDPSSLFSAPIPGTNSVVFGRTTQRVHTQVVMEDGQTFAIGGMIFHQVNGNTNKVPVLGDLPFVGTMFSSINYSQSEEELIVLVTPHLIDAMDCSQPAKYLPGQETRSPDDFELFLERILEAPRGQRDVFVDHRYVPAYKNGPTADKYPCPNCNGPRGACDVGFGGIGGLGGCQNGSCGGGGCINANVIRPQQAQPMPPAQTAPAQQLQQLQMQLPESGTHQVPVVDNTSPTIPGTTVQPTSPNNVPMPLEPERMPSPAQLVPPTGY